MPARRGIVIAGTAVAAGLAVALAATAGAETSDSSRERPRGEVEDCSASPGWGRRDEFTTRQNLIVGPFALERARPMLAYARNVRGNKIFVYVKGGHRVTLELPRHTRQDIGFAFGPGEGFRNWRSVVRFVACLRGERTPARFDGWPVTSWVGFLLASSPGCVPLLVWVDDEPSPRRAVIRFGVRSCG